MPAYDLASLLAGMRRRQTLTAEDALAVRRVVFAAVEVTPEEAAALVTLNEQAQDSAPEWRQMFVEAMTDYVVRQQHPMGYVDDAKAAWLMSMFSRDGRMARDSELEALAHILEQAASAPDALARFALDEARKTITAGAGALSADDVQLLRRLVFAPGSAGSIAVTREEAEALLDVNDAVRGRDNDNSWTDMFARAVGNAVLAAHAPVVESRQDALRQEAWLNEPAPSGGLWARAFGNLLRPVHFGDMKAPDTRELYEEANRHSEADRATSELVTSDEAGWITARIGRDGEFDENEKALVRFISHYASKVDPALEPLVREAQSDAA